MKVSELSEISYMYIDHCRADDMVFITLSQLIEKFKDRDYRRVLREYGFTHK